jgi:hypothetical protein
MFRRSRGNATVEFAMALPIVVSLILPAFQIIRLSLLQTRLEALAFQVARRLAAEAPAGADLTAAAEIMTAGVRPRVTCRARLRALTTLAVPFPRRPRSVDIVEVDLAADGPPVVPGGATRLSAHAREFRWGRP